MNRGRCCCGGGTGGGVQLMFHGDDGTGARALGSGVHTGGARHAGQYLPKECFELLDASLEPLEPAFEVGHPAAAGFRLPATVITRTAARLIRSFHFHSTSVAGTKT